MWDLPSSSTELQPPSRKLSELLAAAGVPQRGSDANDPLITGVAFDSRRVHPGALYVALPGLRAHGAAFAATAVAAGAAAILTDPPGEQLLGSETSPIPVRVVADPRTDMGRIAAEFFGHPAQRLTMIGITGTNGKTTTTELVAAALRAQKRRVGLVGTLGFSLDGEPVTAAHTTVTTPESVDLHALLAEFVRRGADTVVMEVSSHAMALARTSGVRFRIAGFTNLGVDHLDFHGDLEAYAAAKARLFTPGHSAAGVINIDGPQALRLARTRNRNYPVTTISTRGAADWSLLAFQSHARGTTSWVNSPAGAFEVSLALPGAHNVANMIMALALTAAVGADPIAGARGLAAATVRGRMQRVPLAVRGERRPPQVIVDFAHTPQAVAAAGAALRGGLVGRLIIVVGSGGDRDPSKRRPIGAAAATHADLVVVTDDNPRSEDPAAIRAAVQAGAEAVGRAEVIDGGSRRAAIRKALAVASPSDIVAILGKGHEVGQEINGEVHPFADAAVVAEEWVRSE